MQEEMCGRAVQEEIKRMSNEGRQVLDERCMRSGAGGVVQEEWYTRHDEQCRRSFAGAALKDNLYWKSYSREDMLEELCKRSSAGGRKGNEGEVVQEEQCRRSCTSKKNWMEQQEGERVAARQCKLNLLLFST